MANGHFQFSAIIIFRPKSAAAGVSEGNTMAKVVVPGNVWQNVVKTSWNCLNVKSIILKKKTVCSNYKANVEQFSKDLTLIWSF